MDSETAVILKEETLNFGRKTVGAALYYDLKYNG